jgi:tetratricopeptide (TPR) repeat protein
MHRVLITILLFQAVAYAQGDELFLQGRYDEAAAAFEKVPEIQKSPAILNRLGISYHMLNRFKEAEAAYRRAIRADNRSPISYNNLGTLFYSQRKFGDADSEFRRAADRDADTTTLHVNLRASRYARDNERAASTRANELAAARPLLLEPVTGDFLAVISLLPEKVKEEAWKHETRGDTFAARKLYEDAVIEYKKSLVLDKYNASVANRLGVSYHHLRKLREAEQQYREAVRLRPNYLDAMINLGVIDYVRKDYVAAFDRYTRALKLQPNSVTLLRNLGACLFSMERWDEGMRVYQHALALNPQLFDPSPSGAGASIQMNEQGNFMLHLQLAKLVALAGDTDRAISFLYRAIEAGLDNVKLLSEEQAFKGLSTDIRFTRMLETVAAGRSRI